MTAQVFKKQGFGFAAGLLAGWLLSGVLGVSWHTPAHAVATDRHENFAIATGAVDTDVEAIYFLDFLTGNLRAAVLNTRPGQGFGRFATFYENNILADLEIDADKNPRFLMVTGYANFPNAAGGARIGNSVVYVAEITSGKVVAYGIPWVTGTRNVPAVQKAAMIKLDMAQFRDNIVRD